MENRLLTDEQIAEIVTGVPFNGSFTESMKNCYRAIAEAQRLETAREIINAIKGIEFYYNASTQFDIAKGFNLAQEKIITFLESRYLEGQAIEETIKQQMKDDHE
jgi:hypothetical protein